MSSCSRCNGTGVIYYYDTPIPCEECNGDKINANWKPPLGDVRKKFEKGGEKLTQDETSALVDQYWIDSFEASLKRLKRRRARNRRR